jgi:hypothetical protein
MSPKFRPIILLIMSTESNLTVLVPIEQSSKVTSISPYIITTYYLINYVVDDKNILSPRMREYLVTTLFHIHLYVIRT